MISCNTFRFVCVSYCVSTDFCVLNFRRYTFDSQICLFHQTHFDVPVHHRYNVLMDLNDFYQKVTDSSTKGKGSQRCLSGILHSKLQCFILCQTI